MAGPMPQNAFVPSVPTAQSFQRASKLLQETFMIFREGLYDQDTMFTFLDEGNVVLSHDLPKDPLDARMAADFVPIYDLPYAAPYVLNAYPERVKRTLLMIFQCMDSTIVMAPMINAILGPYCSRIEEVHFQPKNEALWARWLGDDQRVTHYILRATLAGSGAQYAVDLTGPQYNWHDSPPTAPWDWYALNRVSSISYCVDSARDSLYSIFTDYVEDWLCDFTSEGTPVFHDDPRRAVPSLSQHFTHGRWMLRRDFADGIAGFEASCLPLAHVAGLPEPQYAFYAERFLQHMRDWVRSVPARWPAIAATYGVAGPVAHDIRTRRLVDQQVGCGRYVSRQTGERFQENAAYSNFMAYHGRQATDAQWGNFLSPQPATAAFNDPTLPVFRPHSPPSNFMDSNPLNIVGVTAPRGAPASPAAPQGGVTAFHGQRAATQQPPLTLPTIDASTDVNRLLAAHGVTPLGQMGQQQIDRMMADETNSTAARDAEQLTWRQFINFDE
ncbi:hypothetical protein IWX90DRAFT_507636 [Phyllosticta citrichinensis]|uniref:Uncharacterized protein n=1 Tax=Phyllosticta citrichinensis TaxID=1130410 RepID=A0ABR1XKT5_9PEZI